MAMGHWNEKIGKEREIKEVTGLYGPGEINKRRKRPIQVAQSKLLKIAETYFKKKEKIDLGITQCQN